MNLNTALVLVPATIGAMTLGAAHALPAQPKPDTTLVQYQFHWGNHRQATTTTEAAEIPDRGETVSTIANDAYPPVLQGTWVVVTVVHTPDDPYRDAIVTLEDQ